MWKTWIPGSAGLPSDDEGDGEYQLDELIDEALMLSEEYYPPMLMTFSDGNAEGENLLEKEGYAMNDDSMYILTTNRFQLGAVALFYPPCCGKNLPRWPGAISTQFELRA